MSLLAILGLSKSAPDAPPAFVREIQDIRGVRVIRLQGTVGREIAREANAVGESAEKTPEIFTRPLLFDFAGTTGSDFSTVSYLILALRNRMAAGAEVGIINATPQLLAELEIAKVEGWFRLFTSEDQALDALSNPGPHP